MYMYIRKHIHVYVYLYIPLNKLNLSKTEFIIIIFAQISYFFPYIPCLTMTVSASCLYLRATNLILVCVLLLFPSIFQKIYSLQVLLTSL